MSPWSKETSEDYLSLGKQAHVDLLFPEIEKLVGTLHGKRILDFGCGEGYFSELFVRGRPDLLLCVDESEVMIREARKIVLKATGDRDPAPLFVCGNETVLPTRCKFDLALCSLALMMEGNRNRLHSAVAGLLDSLLPKGNLLVILTHPCFPRERHPNFQLKLSDSLNYWASGAPYKVVLKPRGKEPIEIVDFHWTLEDYVRAIEEGGGVLRALREFPARFDRETGRPATPPAYLMLLVRKFLPSPEGAGRR